jgi:2-iminobutanoate/2-iminopropanoate deaminase
VIAAEGLPPAPRPYSYAIRAGGWVFVAGMLGFDRTGEIVGTTPGRADARAQARQALENIALALGALGVPLGHVAKVKGYLTDFRHAAAYNEAYREVFARPWPARATVGAGLVRDHGVVEIEATAAVAGPPVAVAPAGRAEPPVPLSQGMQVAGVLFASGQLARDARGALVGRGDLHAQARQALENLGSVLAAAGLGFADVVKVNATVPDWLDVARYDEAVAKSFAVPLPARATVQGAPGIEGMLVEIEAVAVRGRRRVVQSPAAGVRHVGTPDREAVVHASGLPPVPAPHAVQVGDLVHLAGQAGRDAAGRLVEPGDARAQTRRAMENVRLCLEALGGRMDDVVKTNVTLSDYRLVPAFNEEYRAFFTPPYPARTTVVAGLAHAGAVVEIEAVAVLGAAEHGEAVIGAG